MFAFRSLYRIIRIVGKLNVSRRLTGSLRSALPKIQLPYSFALIAGAVENSFTGSGSRKDCLVVHNYRINICRVGHYTIIFARGRITFNFFVRILFTINVDYTVAFIFSSCSVTFCTAAGIFFESKYNTIVKI